MKTSISNTTILLVPVDSVWPVPALPAPGTLLLIQRQPLLKKQETVSKKILVCLLLKNPVQRKKIRHSGSSENLYMSPIYHSVMLNTLSSKNFDLCYAQGDSSLPTTN